MTTKTPPKDLTLGWRIVLIVNGLLIFPLMMIWLTDKAIKTGDYPHLVKREYHWTHMEDFWMYATSDTNLSLERGGVRFSSDDPVGGIVKTSEGAWKAMWRSKPCGAGEYLNRELAERCIEDAAQNDGFFGYVIRIRNHEKDWKDVAGK